MFYLIYNILWLVLFVPVLLFNLYRSIKLGWPLALAERFGRIPRPDLAKLGKRPVIWLHAVSVGEAIAARPLLRALRSRYPDHAFVVSSTTETGKTMAAGFSEPDLCIYFPFDFLPAVRRVLADVRPRLIIIMETEIWPNFTREAARRSIPLLLANGRISDRSFKRYLRFRWFFSHALQLFSTLCMQSETVRGRIIAIGAHPERVVVAGNLKYDIPFHRISEAEKAALRRRFNIPDELIVITAGSTHPGEEELILYAYRDLLVQYDHLLLILAPRHPQRKPEITALLERTGMRFRCRTELETPGAGPFRSGEVLLLDTVGELMTQYALADLALVGGSLMPIGGHNLLEPASVGVPSIFGPHMSNFREIAALVLTYDAGLQFATTQHLAGTLQSLIDDPDQRRRLGQNGLRMMRENGGATERHLEFIARYL
ncbi:MAG: 3-deoxy-D-manno-octulosonic acid transferase [Desulfuromonadales bacterium]|nr:3-deoxy-D-manno-octulosonic acid transferase [Desulfuromonadales bacterium]